MRSTLRALRYARSWTRGSRSVQETEIQIDRGGEEVPATLFLPAGRGGRKKSRMPGDLPGWVVLHGITRPGRRHPGLLRFARALSSTGSAVLIPEIPEWRELKLAPEAAVPTIRAAILALDGRPETFAGGTSVIGFSFGAPQALIAAADPALRGHLAGVVGFGGYADVERAFRFQFTGRHEWEGREERIRPDPYGRWVVGANYLTDSVGYEGAGDVAEALRRLACAAGDQQVESWDPVHEPVKQAVRGDVDPSRRAVFDLFAPSGAEDPDQERSEPLVRLLCQAGRKRAPLLDPLPHLAKVEVPVRLIHGLNDCLIPFTESLRLAQSFPPEADVRVTITGLFEHSGGAKGTSLVHGVREGWRFFNALREILALPDARR